MRELRRRFLPVALGAGLAACSGDGGPSSREVVRGPAGDCAHNVTGFPGDCLIPEVADGETALVAHYGPSDYDDPVELDEFLVLPGAEPIDCVYPRLSNATEAFYNRYDVHSRPGMHHVILMGMPEGTDVVRDGCAERSAGAGLLAVLQGGIDGGVYHYPPSGQIAPENAGIGTPLRASQVIAYELHAVNPTDTPLLRESWTVFHTMPADEVREVPGQLAFNGGLGMNIQPRTTATIENSCLLQESVGNVRVLDFFGHMHAHGERFTAWTVKAGADGSTQRTLIYESYDWSELDLIEFNTATENAPVLYQGGVSGGTSGIIELIPGDRIDYECEMNNTEDFALTFKARAFDGEMCNLFGSFTPGTYWGCLGE